MDKEDKDFIIDALQAYWVQSIKELNSKNLGDIERKEWDKIKDKSKLLMKKYLV